MHVETMTIHVLGGSCSECMVCLIQFLWGRAHASANHVWGGAEQSADPDGLDPDDRLLTLEVL